MENTNTKKKATRRIATRVYKDETARREMVEQAMEMGAEYVCDLNVIDGKPLAFTSAYLSAFVGIELPPILTKGKNGTEKEELNMIFTELNKLKIDLSSKKVKAFFCDHLALADINANFHSLIELPGDLCIDNIKLDKESENYQPWNTYFKKWDSYCKTNTKKSETEVNQILNALHILMVRDDFKTFRKDFKALTDSDISKETFYDFRKLSVKLGKTLEKSRVTPFSWMFWILCGLKIKLAELPTYKIDKAVNDFVSSVPVLYDSEWFGSVSTLTTDMLKVAYPKMKEWTHNSIVEQVRENRSKYIIMPAVELPIIENENE